MFVRKEKIDVIKITEGDFDLDTGECGPAIECKTTILGNIQPATGKTLARLPEGRRTYAKMSMWTETPLDVGTIVLYKGSRLETELVDDWNQPSSTLPHYKYTLFSEGNSAHSIMKGVNSAR